MGSPTISYMLREFWFPVLLSIAGIASGLWGAYSEGNERRMLLSFMALIWFLAFLSYIWGDPVRGPFAGITHPKASDKFRFHAGATAAFNLKDLSNGIDFSKVIKMPNDPIELRVSRTWWAGWEYDITLKSVESDIKINNKKRLIRNLPTDWDYNADDHAIEIVDANLNPVFQLIQASDFDIYLNAILMSNDTVTIMNGEKLIFNLPKRLLSTNGLTRIFKYPSYMNKGERL